MRFVPDGPDIPNDLITKWREGKVLFLAGAGVSVPSRLPLFEGLTLGVYDVLNDSLFSTLKDARAIVNPDERRKFLESAEPSPGKQVEASLFLDKQFDRLFSALEKRLDPDIKGRTKTRNVRDAVEQILSGQTHSNTHQDLLRLSLAPNSAGDSSKPAFCRIVTTNFDLLFESAWKAEFDSQPRTFDARMAPRSGAHDFSGIIHLHGALGGDAEATSSYILSSRDFARVYLRSGVIGNYIYDLIRRYTLVLIGYSADDPPMRYLMDAIGEDASLFDDMKTPYAITDIGADSSEGLEQALWSAKEITAVFFRRRVGAQPFAPLWETMESWANWSREESSWVEARLLTHAIGRYEDARPLQTSFVQDLLSVLSQDELEDAVQFMTRNKVEFDWIDALSAATKTPPSVS
jgi:SIR2-like domain